jgi:cell division protein FtsL
MPAVLTMMLMCAMVSTALAVVYKSQQSRHLFFRLESLRLVQNELDSQWGRLTLERSTLLSHANVEQIATGRLAMGLPAPQYIVVVRQ